jgi:DNA processing protein
MKDDLYWLWLTMVFGTASRRLWQIMNYYETAGEAYYELNSDERTVRLNEKEQDAVKNTSLDTAALLIAECERKGISVVSYGSQDYPQQLRYIIDPPAILYYKGNIRCLSGAKTITAVGARKACAYSLETADRVCTELSANGVVIVSGFAVGIDITSQLAGVRQKRPTASVLGCGLDVDYPRDNVGYRRDIIEAGGVILSEYPPGTSPHPGNFPKRNRILAALGRAVVVFEASEKSGSLITASLAVEHGRDVFCMPPSDISSPIFSGNVKLLKEGASAFYSAADIISCFAAGTVMRSEIRSEINSMFANHRTESAVRIDENDKNAFDHIVLHKNNAPYVHEIKFASNKVQLDEKTDVIKPDGMKKGEGVLSGKTLHSDSIAKSAAESAVSVDADDKHASDHTALHKDNASDAPEAGNTTQIAQPDKKKDEIKLEGMQKDIADVLSEGALHADIIAQRLGVDLSELMLELTEMEILGAVRLLPGKVYEKC